MVRKNPIIMGVVLEIRKLENIAGLSKHDQLVQGIINAVNDKHLRKGDMLPSINWLIKELGFARETIAKGYRDLQARGIVESRNRVGLYINDEDTDKQLRVALIIYGFDSFQEVFYKSFRNRLGGDVSIDVFFHHNNIDVFDNIVSTVRGRYGMYVVAPIPHKRTAGILHTLPMEKFLMVDRYEPLDLAFSSVTQEFRKSSYRAFTELQDVIKSYKGMVYYHHPEADTPVEILHAYNKFVRDCNIKSTICWEYVPGSIEPGYVYFTASNMELLQILKDSISKNLKPGKDIGILSHNDDLVKEIICNGITTYSTDFAQMAIKAAQFVLDRKPVKEIIPTVLIRRKSL